MTTGRPETIEADLPSDLEQPVAARWGGPATGVFLWLVLDDRDDLEIPGRHCSFGRLIDAQADGDLHTLRVHGLPVARVRLPASDPAGAIDELTGRLR